MDWVVSAEQFEQELTGRKPDTCYKMPKIRDARIAELLAYVISRIELMNGSGYSAIFVADHCQGAPFLRFCLTNLLWAHPQNAENLGRFVDELVRCYSVFNHSLY